MILISNAIPKSASTLIANQQCHLLAKVRNRTGQEALARQFGGRYIETPSRRVLMQLAGVNVFKGSCVVKCHWGYNRFVSVLLRAGLARMTLCYRDPRDIVLSALDHGNRSRRGKDPSMAFANLHSFEDSVAFTESLIQQFECWVNHANVHCIRYETLMDDQLGVLRNMCDFLNWPVNEMMLSEAVKSELKKKEAAWNFNKGVAYRYRTEMTEEQIRHCNSKFTNFIKSMGYEM